MAVTGPLRPAGAGPPGGEALGRHGDGVASANMEPARARELLARERERIESALALHSGAPAEGDENVVAGDDDGEGLYQDELDAGRRRDLERQLAALERAEQRLANGTYGLSVLSGQPIPEARLEARPTAELTVEEQQAQG